MNLDLFLKLCGEDALAKVVLVTTKWGEVTLEVGERRLHQLTDSHWRSVVDSVGMVCRFEDTTKSAWAVLNMILDKMEQQNECVPRIQEELVDLRKCLAETEVGQELRFTLKQFLEMQKEILEGCEGVEGAALVRRVRQQFMDLRVPLSRRILLFLGLRVRPRRQQTFH